MRGQRRSFHKYSVCPATPALYPFTESSVCPPAAGPPGGETRLLGTQRVPRPSRREMRITATTLPSPSYGRSTLVHETRRAHDGARGGYGRVGCGKCEKKIRATAEKTAFSVGRRNDRPPSRNGKTIQISYLPAACKVTNCCFSNSSCNSTNRAASSSVCSPHLMLMLARASHLLRRRPRVNRKHITVPWTQTPFTQSRDALPYRSHARRDRFMLDDTRGGERAGENRENGERKHETHD